MDTDLARFAFELAIRRLEQQERSVSELRARTGTVLGASAITASVLGVRTVGVDRSRALFVSGLGAFVVSVLASILVLLPLSGLAFAVRSSAVAESERDDPDGIGETFRRLAYWIEGFAEENDERRRNLAAAFGIATATLALEAILWSVELFTR